MPSQFTNRAELIELGAPGTFVFSYFERLLGNTGWSQALFANRLALEKYRNVFTMGGHMTTTSHLFFAFVLMGQFQLLFLMFQGRSMTARLQSWGEYIRNLSRCMREGGGSAA